ncbi:DNA polymerase IV [Marinisporobacter balticus]|uniref:DNA polymerase IV n=1 Tax=Marinisporobacter balticus TaxID=2018667 RepID=A0A4R2KZ52_9FIRM|nr:DNA polymerase IV [Marinisporobacter balticus]TCO79384.1 DNA polymerase-4 [Marinisporobacter balticus]
MDRKIIHVDVDAFFASVEQRDNPKLKGKPVIVGGTSDRGVVATCSYEARRYGIHSAMPIFKAKKQCPYGIFLPTRHSRYKEVSEEIFKLFYSITDLVEPISIDEAYLDITKLNRNPRNVAYYIKEQVKKKTGLTVSIGISYNKFLAKLGSDWNKPNGLKVITEDMIPEILKPLPIKKVHGLGNTSCEKLNKIGIFIVEDLLKMPSEYLVNFLGKYGIEVYDRIRGNDTRVVKNTRVSKSIGRETTLEEDTHDKTYLEELIFKFAKDISTSLKRKHLYGKTITIKIKLSNFESHTKSKTINEYINSFEEICMVGVNILNEIDLDRDIRLIGLSVSNLSKADVRQLNFFDLENDFCKNNEKL